MFRATWNAPSKAFAKHGAMDLISKSMCGILPNYKMEWKTLEKNIFGLSNSHVIGEVIGPVGRDNSVKYELIDYNNLKSSCVKTGIFAVSPTSAEIMF